MVFCHFGTYHKQFLRQRCVCLCSAQLVCVQRCLPDMWLALKTWTLLTMLLLRELLCSSGNECPLLSGLPTPGLPTPLQEPQRQRTHSKLHMLLLLMMCPTCPCMMMAWRTFRQIKLSLLYYSKICTIYIQYIIDIVCV